MAKKATKQLTVAEVAKKEKVTSKTIYEWIKDKKVSGFSKVGSGKSARYIFDSDYKII